MPRMRGLKDHILPSKLQGMLSTLGRTSSPSTRWDGGREDRGRHSHPAPSLGTAILLCPAQPRPLCDSRLNRCLPSLTACTAGMAGHHCQNLHAHSVNRIRRQWEDSHYLPNITMTTCAAPFMPFHTRGNTFTTETRAAPHHCGPPTAWHALQAIRHLCRLTCSLPTTHLLSPQGLPGTTAQVDMPLLPPLLPTLPALHTCTCTFTLPSCCERTLPKAAVACQEEEALSSV